MKSKLVSKPNIKQKEAVKTKEVGKKKKPSFLARGGEIDALVEREKKEIALNQAKRAKSVGDFWLEKDSEAEVVVLDTEDEYVTVYEHNLKVNGKWGNYETCIKTFDNCPLCESGNRSSFTLLLTVVDARGYTDRNGNAVTHSKKVLRVKGQDQIAEFRKALNWALKKHKTTRGLALRLVRGSQEQSFRIGEIGNWDDDEGIRYGFFTEKEIVKKYGHKAILNNGVEVQPENHKITVTDYDSFLEPKTKEELVNLYGGALDDGDEVVDSTSAWDEDEEEETTKARPSRSRTKAKAKVEEEDEEDDFEDETESEDEEAEEESDDDFEEDEDSED